MREMRIAGSEDDIRLAFDAELFFQRLGDVDLTEHAEPALFERLLHACDGFVVPEGNGRLESVRDVLHGSILLSSCATIASRATVAVGDRAGARRRVAGRYCRMLRRPLAARVVMRRDATSPQTAKDVPQNHGLVMLLVRGRIDQRDAAIAGLS